MNLLLLIIVCILYIIFFLLSSKLLIVKFDILNIIKKDDDDIIDIYDNVKNDNKPLYYINSIPSGNLNTNINNKITSDNLYEYDDKNYKDILYNILDINDDINTTFKIRKIKWSNWIDPDYDNNKLINNYNTFIKYLEKIFGEKKKIIKYNIFKKYKYNKENNNITLFDIDLLLYRDKKLFGKHINLNVYYDQKKYSIIYLKVIGNVNEYDINNNNYLITNYENDEL